MPVSEPVSALYWLRLAQLLIAIPLFALAGQAVVWVLARVFGQLPRENVFYRILQIVASPVVKVARWITPRFVIDQHVPLVAFFLLLVGYAWVTFEIGQACVRAGLTIASCLQ
jgi:hypothetical protein